ncbi:hypothetical protein BC567DRAFT_300220 [Phyllosticta citribraziliensis]
MRTQCSGITKKGVQCSNLVKEGFFCHCHINKDPTSSSTTFSQHNGGRLVVAPPNNNNKNNNNTEIGSVMSSSDGDDDDEEEDVDSGDVKSGDERFFAGKGKGKKHASRLVQKIKIKKQITNILGDLHEFFNEYAGHDNEAKTSLLFMTQNGIELLEDIALNAVEKPCVG